MLQSASRGGVPGPGGCLVRGGYAWSRGVCSWGVCLVRGGIPACTVDRQTLVKILPWPNFVAAGNNGLFLKYQFVWSIKSEEATLCFDPKSSTLRNIGLLPLVSIKNFLQVREKSGNLAI